MARNFVQYIDAKMDEYFPVKRFKSKATDDPWMSPHILQKIKTRMKTYLKEKRSDKWKDQKKQTDRLIKDAKKKYYEEFLEKSKVSNKPSMYYNMVNRLKNISKAEHFEVNSLYPDLPEADVAEKVADFFCKISGNFSPLSDKEIPGTPYDNDHIYLKKEDVCDRLKNCKKPNGLLSGDVFPSMLKKFASQFSVPLTTILNLAFRTERWPSV